MSDTAIAEVQETSASQGEATAPVEVSFDQPKKGVHEYVSSNVEGYKASLNKDKKTWTLAFNGEPLVENFTSRKMTFDAATRHHQTGAVEEAPASSASPGANKTGAQPKAPKGPRQASRRQQIVLAFLASQESKSATQDEIVEGTQLEFSIALTQISTLLRLKELSVLGQKYSITEQGEQTLAAYVEPAAPPPKEAKPKRSQEELRAATRARMIEKYGEPPAEFAVPPTKLEILQARLRNAESSLELQVLDVRAHPWSEAAKKKLASAKERVGIWEDRVKEEADKVAQGTPSEVSDTDTTSEE